MRLPRLLPLVAVAAGGVLAINAIENGPGIVGAARSFAEGVAAKPDAGAKPASALPPGAGPASAPQVVAARPAPVCAQSASELAREAGLSPAELQVIQSLGARRGELDQREQGLSTELALIQAAEAKVDAKIAAMNGLKGDMQTMLGQLDAKQQAEVMRLVKVYEDMKPPAAAARFSLLTDEVRLPIAAQMKEQKLSAIIANMAPADAKHVTEALAARYVAQANAARQAISPTPAPAQAAAAAPPKPVAAPPAKPAAQAASTAAPAAAPVTTTAASDQPAPKPKPAVHRKPRKPKPPAASVASASAPTTPAPKAPAAGAKPAGPPAKSAAAPTPAKSAATTPLPKPAAATPPKSAAAATPPPKPAAAPPAKSAATTPATSTPAAPAPAKPG